jgi:regulator of protease activity HflC (stomatin/prohibitin superfamily)
MSGWFELLVGVVPLIVIAVFVIASSVRILREYERAVIFRFGRRANAVLNPGGDGSGPGLLLLIPLVDKMVKVSLRTITMDVPPQDVITKDNVSVKVNAVIFFRVIDAARAVIAVENYLFATSQIAQTTLRSVLGQEELDDLLASRDKINQELTRIIDEHTSPWGIKVAAVEVKNVDLPQDLQRAMMKQAEAERERRAKVINAEGEFQAAAKLAEAAGVLGQFPIAVQLRYLQTMREVAAERNTTTFFPLPLDLFAPLLRAFGAAAEASSPPPPAAR